ncbi:MAG: hypothetical protein Q7R83_03370 [bacterium]|nr:hypothetical protein [bacterium]
MKKSYFVSAAALGLILLAAPVFAAETKSKQVDFQACRKQAVTTYNETHAAAVAKRQAAYEAAKQIWTQAKQTYKASASGTMGTYRDATQIVRTNYKEAITACAGKTGQEMKACRLQALTVRNEASKKALDARKSAVKAEAGVYEAARQTYNKAIKDARAIYKDATIKAVDARQGSYKVCLENKKAK